MTQKNEQYVSDEIDLADLIRALWQGKWLVIGVTLATLALGIAYLIITPKNYTASLNILALPDSQADVYIELNESKFIAADKQTLLTMFVEDLKTQRGNGLGLSIASVTPTQSGLNFPTQAPGQLTQTVAGALELAKQNVNQYLGQSFSRHTNKLVREGTIAIKALDVEREQKIVIFKADQNKLIAILKEQVTLARFLSIEKGSLSSLTGFTALKVYEQGYLALEKEIELIQSRKVEDFIPDLARIEFLQAELLKNKEVKSVEMMLAKTPIGSDQFAAAVYNLDTLVYKNNTKTSLILALSIVLGGMLGIFVLLIRNVLIKQD